MRRAKTQNTDIQESPSATCEEEKKFDFHGTASPRIPKFLGFWGPGLLCGALAQVTSGLDRKEAVYVNLEGARLPEPYFVRRPFCVPPPPFPANIASDLESLSISGEIQHT